jgi:hypothetical protein
MTIVSRSGERWATGTGEGGVLRVAWTFPVRERVGFGAAVDTPVPTRSLRDEESGILAAVDDTDAPLRRKTTREGDVTDATVTAVHDFGIEIEVDGEHGFIQPVELDWAKGDSVFLISPMPEERRRALQGALGRCNAKGAHAKIWSYHVTHSMLHLRVELPDGSAEDICCGACKRIECSPWWRNVHLRFEDDPLDSTLFHLVDDGARFHVVCGVVLTGCPPDPSTEGESDTG